MRVLMTGGYGCIGAWVARQLVEAGREVWICDLEEDRHRLDLLLGPGQFGLVHFLPVDVADAPGLLRAAESMGPRTCSTSPGCTSRPAAPTGCSGRGSTSWARSPFAHDLDDSRLEARLGPIPRTPLDAGVAETYRRFAQPRDAGLLDLSDL